jgi:hypothetical protein
MFPEFSTLKESLKYSPMETSAVAVIDVSMVTRENPINILESQGISIEFSLRLLELWVDANEKPITYENVTAAKRHPDKGLLAVTRSGSSTKFILLEKDCAFDKALNDFRLSLSL